MERHQEIAGVRSITMSDLVSEIDRKRDQGNLSSAIRLQVLAHYRSHRQPPNHSLLDEVQTVA
jgi:predicted DNA-binding ribbon-helix-helix protein